MFVQFLSCIPNGPPKQWSFCVFLTSFTVVMTILILSTDLRNRRYIQFNTTIIWPFESNNQLSPSLVHTIRHDYIKSPVPFDESVETKGFPRPSKHLLKVVKNKREGVLIECGVSDLRETAWLERVLDWKSLLTQPHPAEYENLKRKASKSYTAQVCISPTDVPIHAYFPNSTSSTNETLTVVPCFPLYSLMSAFNATHLDMLVLNEVNAPIQVLKSLPLDLVNIRVISFVNHSSGGITEDVCCSLPLVNLLRKWGYTKTSICPSSSSGSSCYFVCSPAYAYCPNLSLRE